ncbi:hypothetical protein BGZ60DRAFT_77423 [Tricladium varicosporioides]|nr:hypothetical protein BGZ60DRAFT_77423 [Hymenoscyphus varicosporioides]
MSSLEIPMRGSRIDVRQLLQTPPMDDKKIINYLPEPNDLVFFAEQSIRNMGKELVHLLQQNGTSVFRRSIIELLIAEILCGVTQNDVFGDPRKHAFESMQIIANLRELGVPPDLESAVDFVGRRAERIAVPYLQEKMREEAVSKRETPPNTRKFLGACTHRDHASDRNALLNDWVWRRTWVFDRGFWHLSRYWKWKLRRKQLTRMTSFPLVRWRVTLKLFPRRIC